ncbi:MAG TPA: [protein-PII] uridylyltransferase [Planctomycetaceae bacterium]|nr:[protein-PII] uridylyltransferase [Planctomycetaceae bacterium]
MVEEPATALERAAQRRAHTVAVREAARARYKAGDAAVPILATLSGATDKLALEILEDALRTAAPAAQDLIRNESCLVAVGGTGRGERAPFSDIDLLFLYRKPASQALEPVVAQFVRDFWDCGLKLGHSVRTVEDALAHARTDPQFATSLVELRSLWGNEDLATRLQRRFSLQVGRWRTVAFIDECVAERAGETTEHGVAVQQLEPDVKRSAGGLRDLHLIRWVGFARFGSPDFDLLRRHGALSREDLEALRQAHEFLSRIRLDLHFAAGKSQDLLTREEQLRIAEEWRIPGGEGQRPVERFMQTYFRHTTAIASIAHRFVRQQRPRSLLGTVQRFILTHRANEIYRVGPDEIDVPERFRAQACADLDQILRMYELASLYRVLPAPGLADTIKAAAPKLPAVVTRDTATLCRSILSRPASLGPVLRSMFETGVLDKLLPEVTHVRCLLQFNQYHRYTVDEHSMRAVEAATSFEQDPGSLGTAYREIHHRDLLHLALLLHDLGKGFPEDHSEVGRRIAEDVAERFSLPAHLGEILVFLVHKHLMMTHLAFRRDTSDPDVLVRFARDVGSPETLRMLYVMSAADITAVGPEAWSNWKAEVLQALYERALSVLSGEPTHFRESERLRRIRDEVHALLAHNAEPFAPAWIDETLDTFPFHYLASASIERIAGSLRAISRLKPDEVLVESEYDPANHTIAHRIITHDHIGSGCFHKISGVLTAKRLEILSAQINTTTAGIVLDTFHVVDYDFTGEVPESRLEEIGEAIRDVLTGKRTVENVFQTHRRFGADSQPQLSDEPTRVVIDNDSSDRYTIIDVFAHDRTGLLYTIAGAIRELDLSIALAKIATHLDQVVDVFYVVDQSGSKVHEGKRLAAIRDHLFQRIEEFERSGLPTGEASTSQNRA